ncbi:hypothetical protein [Mycolicibacter minnesotensis]
MNTEIDVRAHVAAVLAELPGEAELAELPAHSDLNPLARQLEQAHDVLVRALESVEKG